MNRLTNLKITRVDRCFKGTNINPEAEVVLFKAAPMAAHEFVDENSDGKCDVCGMTASEHQNMTKATEPPAKTKEPSVADEKVDKALAEKVLRLETDLGAAQETLKALEGMDNDTLAALRGFEIAKAKPEEEVLKGLPDEVRERIEKAESRVAKMEQERRVEQFTKAASEYANVASSDDLAPILEAVDRLDPEIAKALTPILKAANARIAEGSLFSEFGKADAESDPFVAVKAQAAELRKANPDLGEAEALQQAMANSPEAARQAFTRQ